MPRRRSRQSKWMKNPQNVNWRGQRPKFNLQTVPVSKPHQKMDDWKLVKKNGQVIVDSNKDKVVYNAKGEIINLVTKFDLFCDPRLQVEIRLEEIKYQQTKEARRERIEAKLRSLLKHRAEGD